MAKATAMRSRLRSPFASTLAWAAGSFCIGAFGWRDACLAWAAVHLLIALPVNRFLLLPIAA